MKNKITLILAFALTACATVPRGPQKIGSDGNGPQDILEDYATVSKVHLLPANIANALEKNPESAKDLICSASRPNLKLTLTVKVIPPNPAPNQPLDVAGKAKVEFLNNVRDFLKYRFFMALAKAPKASIGARDERTQYDVPIIRDSSRSGIETFYKSLRYQPTFYEKRWMGGYGGNAQMDSQFFAFVFPDRRIILTPKVSEFGLVTLEGDRPAIQRIDLATLAEGNESLPALNIAQNGGLHSQVAVTPSSITWADADRSHFNILRFAETDLGILMDKFTFAFPLEVVESRFKAKNSNAQQLYGYDFNSHKLTPSMMNEQRAFIWESVARESTQIKEHQEQDQILYEISLDLSDFCAYGVSVESLRSK